MSTEWYEGYDAGWWDGLASGKKRRKVDWRMYAFLVGYGVFFAVLGHVVGGR